jgi:myo-inositol-1(or 4)-monophosphatase
MTDDIERRLALAIDLARQAGALALRMRGALGPVEAKSPIDFCTAADHAVEEMVRASVTGTFGDTMIGEEDGGEASDSVWVVDPIDGTANFIHGSPRWCISLAFLQAGRIELGVIYQPREERLFWGRRGHGAFLNGNRLRVSHLAHGAAPVVEVGWSERRSITAYCALLEQLTRSSFEFRRHGSGALGLADVAAGLNDAYAELHINAWDALAGLLLVQEAGGVANDFLAGNGLVQGNVLIAATPEIGQALAGMLDTNLALLPAGA